MDRYESNTATMEDEREPSVTFLVSGIVSDVGRLMEQQVQLLRAEIRTNTQRMATAAILASIGGGAFMLGSYALIFAVAYGINAAFPDFPLWACFACVFVLLSLVGGGLIFAGAQKWRTAHAFPEESAQALKDNLQCMNPIRKT